MCKKKLTTDVICVGWVSIAPSDAHRLIVGRKRSSALRQLAWIFFVELYTPYRVSS